MLNFDMHPSASSPGRTYRFFTGAPVLPFGFGLSYTEFHMAKAELVSLGGRHVRVHVAVENRGRFPGAATVLLFAKPPLSAPNNGDLIKKLVDYGRTDVLLVGQQTVLEFTVQTADMAVYLSENATEALSIHNASSTNKNDHWTLELSGPNGINENKTLFLN